MKQNKEFSTEQFSTVQYSGRVVVLIHVQQQQEQQQQQQQK